VSGILEGVVSTLFDHPSLKNVKKPVLVAVVVAARYIYLTQTGSESHGCSQVYCLEVSGSRDGRRQVYLTESGSYMDGFDCDTVGTGANRF
jgi:hypothetical protein